MSRSGRAGMTLLEVLVAVSIIGILLAIVVPAVQSARESSRRSTCQQRLRGIGIALAGYEASNGKFPPLMPQTGLYDSPYGRAPFSLHHYSPHTVLLPYLDQTNIFNDIDFSRETIIGGGFGDIPESARNPIPAFLCPSDFLDRGTNYRACTGAVPSLFDQRPAASGVFSEMKGLPAASIRDGLSHTAVMSERIKSDTNTAEYGPGDYWFSGAAGLVSPPFRDQPVPDAQQLMSDICSRLSTSSPPFHGEVGHFWFWSFYDYTCYNHVVGPNSAVPDCTANGSSLTTRSSPPGSIVGVHKANSRHPGGVNLLFLDGSCRFIANEIDIAVWRDMATRSGSEVAHAF